MFRKVSSVILSALALTMALGFGVASAQDDVPRGGTVVINQANSAGWVRNFNPFAPDPIDGTVEVVYERLVLYDPLDGGQPTWWLATGSEYAEDLLSVNFTLREGVLWSDGEPFTAADVVYTIDLMKEFPALDRGGLLAYVDSAEAIDDLTVKFNLTSVYSLADILIGGLRPVPQHIWSEIEDPVLYTNDDPVATGPFTTVSSFSEQSFTLCRNENYWQEGRPYVDCLQYPAINGNDAANLALINQELDWVGNFVPNIEETFVARDPEHNHYWFAGGSPWVFLTNVAKSPFDDVNVRHAMALAIDYETIRDTAENGYTVVVPENATGIWPRFQDQVPQEVLDKVAEMGLGVYNLDRANQILDEAGYAMGGDGFRNKPDGTPIGPFNIQIVNGWTDVVTAAQIVSQGFQDIGLNATVVTPEFGEWISNLQQGTFDTSLAWSTWGATPYDFFDNIFNSNRINENGERTGQFMPGWTSPEADQLLMDYVATADPAERAAIVGQLTDIYVTNVLSSPLSPWPAWYEYSTLRFVGWPTEDDPYAQGSPWEANSAVIVATTIHCKDDTSCGQS